MPTMKQVFARRAGRLAFGVVLIIGTVYLVLTVCSKGHGGAGGREGDAARILEWTWLTAAGASVAAWAIAAWLPAPSNTGALQAESLVLPTLGAALLLPLTLHLLVFLMSADRHEFDDWVRLSLVITGPTHLVFATLSAVRAYKLAIGRPALSPLKIYGYTVAASCLPFVLLMAIPPILVAITGLPILPLLYGMERLVARERAALAVPALPRAILVLPRR